MATFYHGDCLEQMKRLPDNSIHFIYFNPPFATTYQPWDKPLPWKEVFEQCFRLLGKGGVLAIHCSIPFNYTLIREAPRAPNYSWYWDKMHTTTPLLAKRQPLRHMEEVLIWTTPGATYNPQRVGTETRTFTSDGMTRYVYKETISQQEEQTVVGKYQTHMIQMKRHIRGFATRPNALIELFIKSYTNEGDTILDPTCYKGLSGRIAKSLNRRWIGIDKNFYPEEIIK
jgi:site-specific DNA-methyltransferase (adenine-specific)